MEPNGRRLDGRVCVVAGVGGELGTAVARRFEAEGGIVVGIDRVAHEVGRLALRCDLAEEDEVRQAFERVMDTLGRVDVLYNNAGPISREDRSALEVDVDTWQQVFRDNLVATWLSCKHGIACMLRSPAPRGSVINTASFLAGMGSASAQMAFNAAKAGVEQLSRDLGVELARRGVRVNSLALGPIDTPQMRAVFARIGPDEVARRLAHMPLGRFATLEELAATAAYLASDDAGFVTASNFPLHGGIAHAFTVGREPAPLPT